MQPQAPQDLGRPGVHASSVDDAEAMRPKKNILGNGSGNPSWILVSGYDAYRLRFGRVLECNGAGRTL